MAILLNADLGESWYDRKVGEDEAIMPFLDACNIACGFHGGDALTMLRTVELATRHGVAIGAHPSFPDRKNFGRTAMHLSREVLHATLLYQISALDGMVRAVTGSGLHHVKLHGALYHIADRDQNTADTVAQVSKELGVHALFGPSEGALEKAAKRQSLSYLAEGFVDRRYEPSLHLRSRKLPDANLEEVSAATEQALLLASGFVRATDGNVYPIRVQTLCIHGDHAGAADRARAVRVALDAIPPR